MNNENLKPMSPEKRQVGRPKGRQNWATIFREALESVGDFGELEEERLLKLWKVANDPGDKNYIAANEIINNRLYGKVKDNIQIDSNQPQQNLIAINSLPPALMEELIKTIPKQLSDSNPINSIAVDHVLGKEEE